MSKARPIEQRLANLGAEPQRESFVFYKSFLEQLEELAGDEQAQLAIAIPRYALRRIEPTFEKGYMRAIWSGIKPQLDANWHKYLNALNKDKDQTHSKAVANDEQTRSKAVGNENENENVNENDNENDNAPALASLVGQKAFSEFALGLSLLRRGYIVTATKLHAVYAQAVTKNNPLAYAEKAGFRKFSDPAAGAVCANFVETTRCKDTRALELYGVAVDDEKLQVRCTAAAEQAIGAAGMDNAQAYAAQVGAKFIEFYSNAE